MKMSKFEDDFIREMKKQNNFWQDIFQSQLQDMNMFNKQPGYVKKNIINVPIWQ